MLNNSLKNQTKNTYKSTASSDRKSRIGQKIIVTEIAKTIFSEEGKILVAEIPTGTGKKLIITTSTVVLQEQVVQKDLPHFMAKSGLNLKPVAAKGHERYACLVHLAKKAGYASKQTDMFARGFGETECPSGSLKAAPDALEPE